MARRLARVLSYLLTVIIIMLSVGGIYDKAGSAKETYKSIPKGEQQNNGASKGNDRRRGSLEARSKSLQRSLASRENLFKCLPTASRGYERIEEARLKNRFSTGNTDRDSDSKNTTNDNGKVNFDGAPVYTVTAYTAGPESTGKCPGDPGYGMTATDTYVKEGRTIAADWDVLPPGTEVYIEKVGRRVVEDRGAAVKMEHIDLYFAHIEDAQAWGNKRLKVIILKKGAKI